MVHAVEKTAVLVMAPLVFAFMAVAVMNYVKGEEIAQIVHRNACLDRQGWDNVLSHLEAGQESGHADKERQLTEGRDDGLGSIRRGQQAEGAVPACP